MAGGETPTDRKEKETLVEEIKWLEEIRSVYDTQCIEIVGRIETAAATVGAGIDWNGETPTFTGVTNELRSKLESKSTGIVDLLKQYSFQSAKAGKLLKQKWDKEEAVAANKRRREGRNKRNAANRASGTSTHRAGPGSKLPGNRDRSPAKSSGGDKPTATTPNLQKIGVVGVCRKFVPIWRPILCGMLHIPPKWKVVDSELLVRNIENGKFSDTEAAAVYSAVAKFAHYTCKDPTCIHEALVNRLGAYVSKQNSSCEGVAEGRQMGAKPSSTEVSSTSGAVPIHEEPLVSVWGDVSRPSLRVIPSSENELPTSRNPSGSGQGDSRRRGVRIEVECDVHESNFRHHEQPQGEGDIHRDGQVSKDVERSKESNRTSCGCVGGASHKGGTGCNLSMERELRKSVDNVQLGQDRESIVLESDNKLAPLNAEMNDRLLGEEDGGVQPRQYADTPSETTCFNEGYNVDGSDFMHTEKDTHSIYDAFPILGHLDARRVRSQRGEISRRTSIAGSAACNTRGDYILTIKDNNTSQEFGRLLLSRRDGRAFIMVPAKEAKTLLEGASISVRLSVDEEGSHDQSFRQEREATHRREGRRSKNDTSEVTKIQSDLRPIHPTNRKTSVSVGQSQNRSPNDSQREKHASKGGNHTSNVDNKRKSTVFESGPIAVGHARRAGDAEVRPRVLQGIHKRPTLRKTIGNANRQQLLDSKPSQVQGTGERNVRGHDNSTGKLRLSGGSIVVPSGFPPKARHQAGPPKSIGERFDRQTKEYEAIKESDGFLRRRRRPCPNCRRRTCGCTNNVSPKVLGVSRPQYESGRTNGRPQSNSVLSTQTAKPSRNMGNDARPKKSSGNGIHRDRRPIQRPSTNEGVPGNSVGGESTSTPGYAYTRASFPPLIKVEYASVIKRSSHNNGAKRDGTPSHDGRQIKNSLEGYRTGSKSSSKQRMGNITGRAGIDRKSGSKLAGGSRITPATANVEKSVGGTKKKSSECRRKSL